MAEQLREFSALEDGWRLIPSNVQGGSKRQPYKQEIWKDLKPLALLEDLFQLSLKVCFTCLPDVDFNLLSGMYRKIVHFF